jgi:hypothetical protein
MLQLFRIESERLKLSAPFSRRIAEPLDSDAAGQATFYCCFDKIGGEEGDPRSKGMPPWVAPAARTLIFVRMSLSLRSRTSALTPRLRPQTPRLLCCDVNALRGTPWPRQSVVLRSAAWSGMNRS